MPTDNKKNPDATVSATAPTRRIVPERRAVADRRSDADRRQSGQSGQSGKAGKAVAVERRVKDRRAAGETGETGERRKIERRINEYPLDAEVLEFINAVNEFKSVQQKPFPTWSDIFGIFAQLGYRRE